MIVRMEPEAYREVVSLAEFANACLDALPEQFTRAESAPVAIYVGNSLAALIERHHLDPDEVRAAYVEVLER
jgi:hypothetical protein